MEKIGELVGGPCDGLSFLINGKPPPTYTKSVVLARKYIAHYWKRHGRPLVRNQQQVYFYDFQTREDK